MLNRHDLPPLLCTVPNTVRAGRMYSCLSPCSVRPSLPTLNWIPPESHAMFTFTSTFTSIFLREEKAEMHTWPSFHHLGPSNLPSTIIVDASEIIRLRISISIRIKCRAHKVQVHVQAQSADRLLRSLSLPLVGKASWRCRIRKPQAAFFKPLDNVIRV